MKRLIILIGVLSILLLFVPNTQSAENSTEKTVSILSVEFNPPVNPDFGNYMNPSGIINHGYKFKASLAMPIIFYRAANGEWPSSWEQVRSYIPLLPIDYVTGEPYILGDYNDYNGHAPANVILAAWDTDAPEMFIANPSEEGLTSIKIGKEEFLDLLVLCSDGSPGINKEIGLHPTSAQFRLSSIMFSMSTNIVSDFSFRHRRLPESKEEFLECYTVNPDFDPGYTKNTDNNFGTFEVIIDLENNMSIFNSTVGPRGYHFSYPSRHGSVKEGGGIMADTQISSDGEFITIFTEEAFF